MARVDYFAIEEAVQTQLQADSTLAGVQIMVEEGINIQEGNIVVIYITGRECPEGMQSIAAGRRSRFLIHLDLLCAAFNPLVKEARKQRDDLLGKVELAFLNLADKSFGRAEIQQSWIAGGEFYEGLANNNLYSAGTVRLTIDASAVA